MKPFLLPSLLLLLCFFATTPLVADKLTDYSAASSLLSTDIFYVVTNPGSTPATKKATFSTLFTLEGSYSQTLTNKTISFGANTLTLTSAQLKTACSDETGSGALVFGTSPTIATATLSSPTLTTPVLGTPSSGTLTNCTGLPVSSGISGLGTGVATFLATPSSANLASAITNETGSGLVVFATQPTLTNPAIIGTTTNDSVSSGYVGEYVESEVPVGSAVSLTTATAANITSISLTAGDWDVTGNVNFSATSATITALVASTNTGSATLRTDGSEVYSGTRVTTTSITDSISLPPVRFSLAATTTVYLVGKATFSAGTVAGFGAITARRVR